MSGRRVSEDEVRFIIENCDRITVAEIARILGRWDKTISTIIKKRGIKRTYFNRWTEDEDRYVRENYLQMTATQMASTLGRTESATASRRFSLGLTGRDDAVRNSARTDISGYVYRAFPDQNRKIPEHKGIAESDIGRKLLPGECVHHINTIKSDNRPENLHVCTKSEHSHAHQSINRLVAPLIEMGIIWFDTSDHKYKLTELFGGEN